MQHFPAAVLQKAFRICAAELKSCALSDAQSKSIEPGVEETHGRLPLLAWQSMLASNE